jgi:hypothetical protein
MFQTSTIMPLVMHCLNPRGRVSDIYAYAPAPFTGERIRVRVESVRLVGLLDSTLVADVCALAPHCLPFSVRIDQLTSISVFVTWELQS